MSERTVRVHVVLYPTYTAADAEHFAMAINSYIEVHTRYKTIYELSRNMTERRVNTASHKTTLAIFVLLILVNFQNMIALLNFEQPLFSRVACAMATIHKGGGGGGAGVI